MGQEGRVQIPIVHSSLALEKHVNLPALRSSCVIGRYGHCTWGLGSIECPWHAHLLCREPDTLPQEGLSPSSPHLPSRLLKCLP